MALIVNILQTPAQSLTYKLYPVYNGLPFMVNSNSTTRSNFKYIADIYVGGTKVTQLKQNKDISANNNGVFDIGRIVENFIQSVSPTFQTYGFAGDNKAYQSYQVKFGAEFDRTIKFSNIIAGSGGFARLILDVSHNLRVLDTVTIENATDSYYNGSYTVQAVTTTTAQINKVFTTSASGTVIEGERFYDNYYVAGALIGWAIPSSRPTRINVGDTVVIKQDAGATYQAYNGEWLVTSIFNANVGGIPHQIISTNCPFLGSTPAQGGTIYSQNKYKFTDISTSTLEYAFDAALQYKELGNWNPTSYSMNTTNKGKFLTNAPSSQYIRLDEDCKLTFLNTSIFGASTSVRGIFKTYNSAGIIVSSFVHTLGGVSLTTGVVNTGVGTKNLVNLNANALPSTVAYYTYELQTSTGIRISEIRTFLIDTTCYRHTIHRFKWKNRMGGWDYFSFQLRSDVTVNIQRSNYRKMQNHYNSTTSKYGYAIGDRGNTTYNVNAKDSEIILSDWLTNDEATWLEELFTSPEVYLLVNGSELPINITTTDVVIGEKENNKLLQYSIAYDYSYNKVIQRG